MIGVLLKMIICGILVCVIVNIDEYWHIKNRSCEKILFGKLVLACENEILNTTETSLDDKKVTCQTNDCLIHTIGNFWSMVIL